MSEAKAVIMGMVDLDAMSLADEESDKVLENRDIALVLTFSDRESLKEALKNMSVSFTYGED